MMADYYSCVFSNPLGELTFCRCGAMCENFFVAELVNEKICKKCKFFKEKLQKLK